jgi:hypothetical protein
MIAAFHSLFSPTQLSTYGFYPYTSSVPGVLPNPIAPTCNCQAEIDSLKNKINDLLNEINILRTGLGGIDKKDE